MIQVHFLSPLDTRAYLPDEFVILNDFTIELLCGDRWYLLTVRRGYITDFASVPWLVQALPGFDVNGDSRRAAVVHDFAYSSAGQLAVVDKISNEIISLQLTREECDQLLYGGLSVLHFTELQTALYYAGVRAGGWLHWHRRRDGVQHDFDFVPETYWSNPQ